MAKRLKAAKPAKAKDLALSAADPDTMAQIVEIANLADPYGEDTEVSITSENLTTAVEVLARVREALRKLEAVHKEATAPFKEQIKPYDAERKSLKDRLERADTAVAARLIELYREVGEEAVERRQAGPLGSKASFVHKGWTITVDDAEKLPDNVLHPLPTRAERVNMAAITGLIDAGVDVPGVTATRKYYITTRAGETITPRVKASA